MLEMLTYHSFHESGPKTYMTVVLWQDYTGSIMKQKSSCRLQWANTCLHINTKVKKNARRPKTNLISSKLYSCFSFDQSGIDLHNDRLYGIGTAPALRVHIQDTKKC